MVQFTPPQLVLTCVATPAANAVTPARETVGKALHMAGARAASSTEPTLPQTGPSVNVTAFGQNYCTQQH